MDFSKKTWNILERHTFHPNMLAFLENVLNWPKWPSFLMLNLIFKVKFIINLTNFVAIEIKLDTENNQIHNKLYFKN